MGFCHERMWQDPIDPVFLGVSTRARTEMGPFIIKSHLTLSISQDTLNWIRAGDAERLGSDQVNAMELHEPAHGRAAVRAGVCCGVRAAAVERIGVLVAWKHW